MLFDYPMSWEQAVCTLRDDPARQSLVRACYYDDPLLPCAERFRTSVEWQALRELLPAKTGHVLDLGAGRGISSYAFARDGWQVTALEPDPSAIVGAEAIRALARDARLDIRVVSDFGEQLPFADASFDLVNCRQALHHARDLHQLCREIRRVLRPGGRLIATREHVISRQEDLDAFLSAHPLHRLYGGEHAYLLSAYLDALTAAGLVTVRVLGPLSTLINAFPLTASELSARIAGPLTRRLGETPTARLLALPVLGRMLRHTLRQRLERLDETPGRLYTFIMECPA